MNGLSRDDIIRMAREAGCMPFRSPEYWDDVQVFATPDVLEQFANLVAAAEREECVKVVQEWLHGEWHNQGVVAALMIRERGAP